MPLIIHPNNVVKFLYFMNLIKIIGFAAATCTTIAFLPQAIKIYRSKCAKDIALPTLVIFIIGVSLWLIYGLLIKDYPVIIANFITLIFNLMILRLKLKYG